MITADSITKKYKIQGKEKVVFQNLSLEISEGGRFALIGPNGAGKSTLLRILTGIERPNKGRVVRKGSVSWPVGGADGFMRNLTAEENIRFVCRLFDCSKQEKKNIITFVKNFADIGEYFNLPISSYSRGMYSRVAFGLSLAFEFDYYIFDETMAVGDRAFRVKCSDMIKKRLANKGIILISHAMNDVRNFCNEGLFLSPGKLTHVPNIEDLIKMYNSYVRS